MTKVIVDTSVWSLLLRRRRDALLNAQEQVKVEELKDLILQDRVAMLGPIRQELLSGIKHETQFEKLKNFLRDYPDEPIGGNDYEDAARLYNLSRSRGLVCGGTDLLICAVAMRRDWKVLSHDHDLDRILRVALPGKREGA